MKRERSKEKKRRIRREENWENRGRERERVACR